MLKRIVPVPTTESSAALTWEPVRADLWIGRRDGRLVGMVEHRPGSGYIAHARLATSRELYDSLDAAAESFGIS